MIQKVSTVAGWSTLAFIVFATLCPIELRPVITAARLKRMQSRIASVIYPIHFPDFLLTGSCVNIVPGTSAA
jgi:hypothetical protein